MDQYHIEQLSKIFNLSEYEARVYLAGLNFKKTSLSQLAELAGISVTAVYPPLKSLIKRGMMQVIPSKKRKYYQSLNPQHLLDLYDRNRAELEFLSQDLSKRIASRDNSLEVSLFQGEEGAEVASDIFLKNSQENWKTIENATFIMRKLGHRQVDRYVDKRVKKGIKARCIIAGPIDSQWLAEHLKRDKEELRKTVCVASGAYPLEASLGVSGDLVQVMFAKDKPASLLIRSAELARTVSSLHDMIWDRYQL